MKLPERGRTFSVADDISDDDPVQTDVYVVVVTTEKGRRALVVDETNEGLRPAAFISASEAQRRCDEMAGWFPKCSYTVASHDFAGARIGGPT